MFHILFPNLFTYSSQIFLAVSGNKVVQGLLSHKLTACVFSPSFLPHAPVQRILKRKRGGVLSRCLGCCVWLLVSSFPSKPTKVSNLQSFAMGPRHKYPYYLLPQLSLLPSNSTAPAFSLKPSVLCMLISCIFLASSAEKPLCALEVQLFR